MFTRDQKTKTNHKTNSMIHGANSRLPQAASRRRLFLRSDGTGRGANELFTGTESLVESQLI